MKNRLQPVFVGFFFLPHLKKLQLVTRTMSKKPDWRFEKNRFRSGCQTGFFRLLQPDFETLTPTVLDTPLSRTTTRSPMFMTQPISLCAPMLISLTPPALFKWLQQ